MGKIGNKRETAGRKFETASQILKRKKTGDVACLKHHNPHLRVTGIRQTGDVAGNAKLV